MYSIYKLSNVCKLTDKNIDYKTTYSIQLTLISMDGILFLNLVYFVNKLLNTIMEVIII